MDAIAPTPLEAARAATRIRTALFAAHSIGSAGFLVASTVNAIAGAALGGSARWAGAPVTAYQVGQAVAAFGWGRLMDPLGRRHTLALGLVSGAMGAGLAGHSVSSGRLWPFLLGLLFMGFAQSALQLGRFVSAEVHPPHQRGRAISWVVMGGTVGAVLGPFVVAPAGRLSAAAGGGELSGPYLASALLLLLASAVLHAFLRPEPRELARALAAACGPGADAPQPARPLSSVLGDPLARLAMTAMVFGQAVMVMLMVITSLYMKGHDHSLSSVSFVISAHVLGMYAVSPLTGGLTDRWGRVPAITLGGAVLLASCLAAPLSPRLVPLTLSLFALGVGWNLCFVAGSALLADRLSPAERARTQGVSDFVMGSASALGAVGGALVFASRGYPTMALLGALGALAPLGLAARLLGRPVSAR